MKADAIAYPPRGLSHVEAARYIGLGVTKFDELVERGLMPRAKRIGGRVIWDRIALDLAFSALPTEGERTTLEMLLEHTKKPALD